jgi:hypothetical protein
VTEKKIFSFFEMKTFLFAFALDATLFTMGAIGTFASWPRCWSQAPHPSPGAFGAWMMMVACTSVAILLLALFIRCGCPPSCFGELFFSSVWGTWVFGRCLTLGFAASSLAMMSPSCQDTLSMGLGITVCAVACLPLLCLPCTMGWIRQDLDWLVHHSGLDEELRATAEGDAVFTHQPCGGCPDAPDCPTCSCPTGDSLNGLCMLAGLLFLLVAGTVALYVFGGVCLGLVGLACLCILLVVCVEANRTQ